MPYASEFQSDYLRRYVALKSLHTVLSDAVQKNEIRKQEEHFKRIALASQ